MNVLKVMRDITINDEFEIEIIVEALEGKLFDLEMKEPKTEGETHDRWEEKYMDLESILIDLRDVDNENDLEMIKEDIEYYQFFHGGLMRLRY